MHKVSPKVEEMAQSVRQGEVSASKEICVPRPPVGGQAVVEGVMMRAPSATAVAVRKPDGSLIVRTRHAHRIADRWPILAKPGLRGIAVLIETMADGMSALNFSATQALPEDEKKKDKTDATTKSENGKTAIIVTMIFAMAFGFALFAVLPHFLTWSIGWLTGSSDLLGGQAVLFHLIDGVIKTLIFLGYVYAMSLMKDMRRVFEYHGAEHQAVHTFERGLSMETANLASFPTAHPRCGTAFMVTVIVVGILIFAGVFPLLPALSDNVALNQTLYVLIKLPLILPIAALSYEVIRMAGKRSDSLFGHLVSAPGVFFQRITTKRPDASQQEVAIVSLEAAMWPERMGVSKEHPETISVFPDFAAFVATQSPASQETGA